MDNNIKIYEPHLVISSIEISGVSAKVSCIECSGSRMFIGTLEGILLEYFITDECHKSKILFSRVRESNLNKGQPIMHIRCASAFDSLIILTGATLSIYDSQTLEMKGTNSVTNVTCFAVDENPPQADPFALSLCLSRRKTVTTAQASEKGFNILREVNLEAVATAVAIESGLVCAALTSGRYVFVDMNSSRKSVQPLCDFDPKEAQGQVIHVGKEEFLVIGPGGLGVFVTSQGTSERPPIVWMEKISQIAVDGINVVAVGSGVIYLNSLPDPTSNNCISFPGAKCLSLSEGKLYVGTARSLYHFKPVSVADQVESLLDTDEIDRALGLIQMSHLKTDEQQILLKKVHQKALFIRISALNLDLAKESLKESGTDLREIISLFPSILPESTTFTRSLPPVHNFLDANQMFQGDEAKVTRLQDFALNVLLAEASSTQSKDLCTALLKLSAKHSKSQFQKLLNDTNVEMNADYDDFLEWLMKFKMYDNAASVHKYRGYYRKALDIWMDLGSEVIKCGEGDEFQGLDAIVNILSGSGDDKLVWEYYEKLCRLDTAKAVEVFKRRKPSPTFPPLKVAERLASLHGHCIGYLEHCIRIHGVEDEDVHTYLATMYIQEVTQEGKENSPLRDAFRHFLIDSGHLKVQFLIGRIKNTNLRLELAILHGKAGDHVPALKVFSRELKDYFMAVEYCKKLKNSSQRRAAFLDLLNIYLEDGDKDTISPHCQDLLTQFGEEFELCSILPLLPDEWSLTVISNLLRRAVRVQIHKQRQATMIRGLTHKIFIDYTVVMDANDQGYRFDEDSVCNICCRRLDSIEPIAYNKGIVVHLKCV